MQKEGSFASVGGHTRDKQICSNAKFVINGTITNVLGSLGLSKMLKA